MKSSVAVRNARLDADWTVIGASPLLRIYTGAEPAAITDAATGTLLASMILPVTPMTAAANGVKTKSGTWSGTAVASGTAGYHRFYDSTGTTCHKQGNVMWSALDDPLAELELDSVAIVAGQVVTVSTYTHTASTT